MTTTQRTRPDHTSAFPALCDQVRIRIAGHSWDGELGEIVSIHGAIGYGSRPCYGIEVDCNGEPVTLYHQADEFTLTGYRY